MAKELNSMIIEILENKDWKVYDVTEQDGKYYVEIENYSPAGENIVETVWFDGTTEGFIDGMEKVAASFDVGEHVEMWVDKRGKNGVPGTVRELLDDAEEIKALLNDTYSDLLPVFEKYKGTEEYFSEWFSIISENDAKQLWNCGDRNFLVLADDGSDRYADCFETWEEIEKTYPDSLFGLDK